MKKREKEKMQENFPWLDPSDERKDMSDREILEKYIDLDIMSNRYTNEVGYGDVIQV